MTDNAIVSTNNAIVLTNNAIVSTDNAIEMRTWNIAQQSITCMYTRSACQKKSGGYIFYTQRYYCECKFLFVDEADRVQIQFDEEFAPDEVLVDASGNSFLNKLGLNLATIYNSDRGDMAGDRFVAWTSAHYHTQISTNRIYHLLLTHSKLVAWLGPLPFTGRSLFTRIIRDLVDPPEIPVSAKTTAT
ncbi:hypothetical protein IQ229_16360 [Nostoc cf. edaphicum LEGE 07299]|uniref:Uncharacterized protein n=1 Tax=Nostoc cf. edaphicum LEGE 07299 TaxID=2777974 RepID=A0ABR9U1J3_9NOSO|nr:hypothetical protein [Nostoc edaphicum]MBE9106443.1 hypothetical protein [Nostoc cf. edaphicum LEGE 07299]